MLISLIHLFIHSHIYSLTQYLMVPKTSPQQGPSGPKSSLMSIHTPSSPSPPMDCTHKHIQILKGI